MAKILVVDDEQDLCEILKFNLQNHGHEVTVANSAEEALALDSLPDFEIVLLDVMMEGMSGFQMAQQMKQKEETANIPIIFCTAKDSENDTLTGFNLGADDYIAKPFRLSEVVARVNAVLRRSKSKALKKAVETAAEESYEQASLNEGPLTVDLNEKRAFVDGTDILLTRKEYDVLVLMMLHRGHLYSREDILERVWPDDTYVLERSVDVTIARLRKKLGNECGRYIVSRSGYGYAFKS